MTQGNWVDLVETPTELDVGPSPDGDLMCAVCGCRFDNHDEIADHINMDHELLESVILELGGEDQ
jgi:hypothetical protein